MHMKYGLSPLQNRLPLFVALHCLVFNNWAESRVIIRFLIAEEMLVDLQHVEAQLGARAATMPPQGEAFFMLFPLSIVQSILWIHVSYAD